MKEKSKNLSIDKLLFDKKNPRFLNKTMNQQEIYDYLVENEKVKDLATQIENNGFQTLGERLICLQQYNTNNYIVLEGNRRLAACKYLQKKHSPCIDSIECDIVLKRDDAIPSISNKHINGVKKWPAITKIYYIFGLYKDGKSIEEISQRTSIDIVGIKKSILKYNFFSDFYKSNNKNLPKNFHIIEQLDTDIITGRTLDNLQRFISLPLTNDKTEIKFSKNDTREILYIKILNILGKAIWTDKLINTRSLNKIEDWDNLINNNNELIKLPELTKTIQDYKQITVQDDDISPATININEIKKESKSIKQKTNKIINNYKNLFLQLQLDVNIKGNHLINWVNHLNGNQLKYYSNNSKMLYYPLILRTFGEIILKTFFNEINIEHYNIHKQEFKEKVNNYINKSKDETTPYFTKNCFQSFFELVSNIKDISVKNQCDALIKNNNLKNYDYDLMVKELNSYVHGSKSTIDYDKLSDYSERITQFLYIVNIALKLNS